MQLPAHRGLSQPAFPFREPFRPAANLICQFPSTWPCWYPTPVYDWSQPVRGSVRKETARYLASPELGCIRRSGGGNQNEAQDVRSTKTEFLRSQHELLRTLYVAGALKHGWYVSSRIIKQPVLYYPCEHATGKGQNSGRRT